MELSSARLLIISIAVSVSVMLFPSCANTRTRKPIEFWHVGDDALSQKLAVAVEEAIRQSSDFRLTPIGPGRRLVVSITNNVGWEKVGERIKATYSVQYLWLDDNLSKDPDLDHRVALAREISTQKRSCWEDELHTCAERIVSDAKIAARKMPQ